MQYFIIYTGWLYFYTKVKPKTWLRPFVNTAPDLFQRLKENDVTVPLVNNSPCIATVTLSATPSGERYVNKFYVLTLIAP